MAALMEGLEERPHQANDPLGKIPDVRTPGPDVERPVGSPGWPDRIPVAARRNRGLPREEHLADVGRRIRETVGSPFSCSEGFACGGRLMWTGRTVLSFTWSVLVLDAQSLHTP